jgi:hypothetical protein
VPWSSRVGEGANATAADPAPAADSSRTPSATSGTAGGAEPLAPSYWRSADVTDTMVSRIIGSANIRSVAASSISRSFPGSLGTSRSMVPMPRKSTYRHAANSMTSSTDAAPAAGEGSDTVDITTSQSPTGGGRRRVFVRGTITTSAPPEPTPAGGSDAAWGWPCPRPSVPLQQRRRSLARAPRPTPPRSLARAVHLSHLFFQRKPSA